jgi:PAS domain S-box-containing protein
MKHKNEKTKTTNEDLQREIAERKRAEEAIKSAIADAEDEKNKSNAIIEAIGDGIIIQDTDYKIIYQNQIQNDLYGNRVGEYCYKTYEGRDTICEDCPIELSFKDGKVHKAERRVPTDNGILYTELTGSSLKDSTGKIIAGIKVVRDITGLKRNEKALQESEKRYRSLFDNANDAIYLINPQTGKIIDCNKKAAEMDGYSIEELKGMITVYLHPPDEQNTIPEKFKEVLDKGSIAGISGFHHVRKDGRLVPVEINASIIEVDGEKLNISIIRDVTERKRAEEELHKGEHFLESVFASIQDGIGIIDKDMNILRVNPTAEGWYPYATPLVGKKCYEAYHRRSERCEACPAWKTLKTGESAYKIVPKHGPGGKEVGWLEIYSFPMIDTTTGEMRGAIEYVRDISERKLVEKEKDRLLKAIDNSTDGITIADEKDRYIYVNAAYAKIFGYTQEEFIGETWRKITPPELIVPTEKEFSRTMHNKDIGTFRGEAPGLRKNGTIIPTEVQGTALRDENGNYLGHICVVRDIAERKRMEETLMLFSEAVENAPDSVQIVDLNGHIIYSNKATEEIYGFSPEEFRGKHVDELNSDPEFASKVILPAMRESGRWVGELTVKHKDGRTFPVWLNASMVKNSKGEPIAMMGIIHDITERKQAEEAIKKYAKELEESNRMKELFIDIMHHDLINPLTAASGFIELLKEDEIKSRKRAYLRTIERNLVKALELMESATRLSKLESSKSIELTDVNLEKVISEVTGNMSPLAADAGMRIENRINMSMPVRANKIIEEVFANIMSNAVKYASSGKRIVLDCEEREGCWNIRFTDFGEGIEDRDKTVIFDRFQRMEKKGVKGSGLGLAIASKIMELHNGRIWVEDNPEGGAVFVVEIPKHLK